MSGVIDIRLSAPDSRGGYVQKCIYCLHIHILIYVDVYIYMYTCMHVCVYIYICITKDS